MRHSFTAIKIALLFAAGWFGVAGAATIPGDIDGDGTVGFSDFVILAGNYGKSAGSFEGTLDDPTPESAAPLNERGFPLAVGNRWKYQSLVVDSGFEEYENLQHIDLEWEVEAKEELGGIDAFRVRTIQTYSGVDTSYSWFTVAEDTLKGVAYIDAPPLPFGQLSKSTTAAQIDDALAWGLNALVFPLSPGKSWTAVPGFGTKTVLAREDISVPAGTYEAYKVRYQSSHESQVIHDILIWYAAPGIVKVVDILVVPDQERYSAMVMELVSCVLR